MRYLLDTNILSNVTKPEPSRALLAWMSEREGFRGGRILQSDAGSNPKEPPHSHSIVPGGLLVTSYTTRLIPFTSLMIRVATRPMKDMS
jgi:hypothetical protein